MLICLQHFNLYHLRVAENKTKFLTRYPFCIAMYFA